MTSRKAKLAMFIGTNGTGKTTAQQYFLKTNERNLVFPSSIYDKAWKGYEIIEPKKVVIQDELSLNGKQKVVYRIPGINSFKGTRVVDLSGINDDKLEIDCFKHAISIKHGFKKGGLFIDDFKGLIISHGTLPSDIRKLFNAMRHIEVDIFMATHGMREVNYQLFQHNPTFYIFKSESPPGKKVESQYTRYNELMEVFNRVQDRAKSNPYYCEKFPK